VYVYFILFYSSNITKTVYETLFSKFYNEDARNIMISIIGDGGPPPRPLGTSYSILVKYRNYILAIDVINYIM